MGPRSANIGIGAAENTTPINNCPDEAGNLASLGDNQGGIKRSEAVVIAAAGNGRSGGKVMALLIERFGDAIDTPDKVLQAAAQNHGVGEKVMTIILERYGDTVKVTEEVVKAAVTLECREQADVDYSAPNTAMHKGANGGTKKTDTWQSIVYSYSFAPPNSDWSRDFPGQKEILSSLCRVAQAKLQSSN
ncbi:hypothetical protein ETB97_007962 [Aspergillus alliaceus]|uniref:Uncharacterized protein n=1 Tax=Petromyces alliaceus TaxID=209559 RepID=A0A8H6E1P2_PETAA|nr:hypothetical protein ETB97_007962 [Aspergillus burnettii]